MSTPRQVVYTPVDIDDADYVDLERDPKAEAENAEFDAFKSEMHDSQDDAKITVGKKLTDSRGRPQGRQVFECFECGIDDYSFSQLCSRIREDFGTGLYQIQGRDSKGKYKFRKVVGILAPNTPDNAPAGNDIGGLIDKFSDAMANQQMRTEAMFKDLVGPRSGGDAMEQMTSMMTAFAGMVGAMGLGPGNQQQPKTLIDQLTEFKMVKELFGDGDGGSGGEANLYSLLGDTIKTFGIPIAAALAAGADSGELSPAGIVQKPALPAPKETVESEEMDTVELAKQRQELKKNIGILIMNAKAEVPPGEFALILVNNTPADKEDALWEFISAENCVEQIIALEPVAAEYREWFNALRDAVIELMSDSELSPIDEDIESLKESDHPVPDDNDSEDLQTGKPIGEGGLQLRPEGHKVDSDATSGKPVAGAEDADNPQVDNPPVKTPNDSDDTTKGDTPADT